MKDILLSLILPLLESDFNQPLFIILKTIIDHDGRHRSNIIGCNGYYLWPII
ncbi:MAG: hypothetical protein ACTS77_01580 [Arsenophonus sp. NC-TX2-MAG3]